MAVTWPSPQFSYTDPAARHSPNSLHADSSRRRSHAAESRASSASFVTSLDPASDFVNLELDLLNIPNIPGSDGELEMSFDLGIDAFSPSPTSAGASDHESFLPLTGVDALHTQTGLDSAFGPSNGMHIHHLSSAMSQPLFAGMAHTEPTTGPLFTVSQETSSLTSSSEPGIWITGQASALDGLMGRNTTPAGPSRIMQRSSSSLTANSSQHDPWSSEMNRRVHDTPGSEAVLFAPDSDQEYAPSVNSIDSPSLLQFMPNSGPISPMRSPIWPHVETPVPLIMNERQLSNNSSLSAGSLVERTQRVHRRSLPRQQRQRNPSLLSIDNKASPSNQIIFGRVGSARASFEMAQSPGSDYIMVHDSSVTAQSSPSPKPTKRKLSDTDVEDGLGPYIVQHNFMNDDNHGHLLIDDISDHVVRKNSNGKRTGGRPPGSHLTKESAARAKELRVDGCCWICCLQRDSCSRGEICERCIKRSQRAQMEQSFSIGCDRTKLVDLKSYFIPDFVNRNHEEQVLLEFCGKHIKRWGSAAINIDMTFVDGLPSLNCEVYEFEPKTAELLRQFQYELEPETGKYVRVEKASPPLAMVQIERADQRKYEKYLACLVKDYMEVFADRFYEDEKDDCMPRLLRLMARLQPDKDEETSLLKDIYKLLIVSYIFGRTATIDPEQAYILYGLKSYSLQTVEYADRVSPRMANRQLKYLFCSIFNNTMESVLKQLQQILRSSKGAPKWTSAFCAILGLAMCFEDMQSTIHVICDADAAQDLCSLQDAHSRADAACIAIDEKFQFLKNLFRMKYHRGINPLKDWKNDRVQGNLGSNALEFAKGVSQLFIEKHDTFLYDRQHVSVSHLNPEKYYGRLVSRFLISFYSPELDF